MISLGDYIEQNKERLEASCEGKVLYPRQELIKMFVDKLNADRTGKYKPLSPKFYAIKMYDAGLKTDWLLWWFWGYCKESKNFSKTWWWALNPKNANFVKN